MEHEDDFSTWPSRYYGRTRHIDLEQLYKDVLTQVHELKSHRRVSFSSEPPIVHEYEPEEDEEDENEDRESRLASLQLDGIKQHRRNLDLRPIPNFEYLERKRASLAVTAIGNSTVPDLIPDDTEDDNASSPEASPTTETPLSLPDDKQPAAGKNNILLRVRSLPSFLRPFRGKHCKKFM